MSKTTKTKPIGTIYKPGTMFLRQYVGDCKAGKRKYEMSVNIGGSVPIIESKQTGKYFTLSWKQIMELAEKAGIDAP